MVAFNPFGRVVPPFLIMSKENADAIVKREWMQGCGACSANAFMTEAVMMRWLVLFRKQAPPGEKLLLLVDNFAAHVTYRVAHWCSTNNIVLFTLPANSTGDVQPADVRFNGAMKAVYRRMKADAGDAWDGDSDEAITRRVRAIIDAWSVAGQARTCASAFAEAGIFPLSVEKMTVRAPGGAQSHVSTFMRWCKECAEEEEGDESDDDDDDASCSSTSDDDSDVEPFDDAFLSVFDVDAVVEVRPHRRKRRNVLITGGRELTTPEMLTELRQRSELSRRRRKRGGNVTAEAGPSGVQ